MGWYRRSKFGFDAFGSFASKIVSRNPIPEPVPRINQYSPLIPTVNNSSTSGFSLSSPIIRNLGFQFGAKQYQYSPFTAIGRRYYYVDRQQVLHFKPKWYRRWYRSPRNVFILVLVGSGVVITVYFGNLETVPYTKRKHFVILPKKLERQIGETQFQQMKAGFKEKILPAMHPNSIRVRLIAKDIIEALQRGLKKEQVSTDLDYGSQDAGVHENSGPDILVALSETAEGRWHKEDEILEDKWIHQGRNQAKKKGSQSATAHLEGLNWEVLVVNEPAVNAFCLPGGKIVVFTGLLKHFRTDAEIATIIGHEVAHAVARHAAEQITKNLWFTIIQLILYQFFMPDVVNAMSNLLLRLPFSRRMEIEADYIGLLLMASAVYDPRVAPKVFEKLGELTGDSALKDYLSTHPSGKKRAKLLADAKVMQEALAIYRETISGRDVEGFFL